MDNRFELPGPEIDFAVKGLSGQDHDNYPAPGQPPRYDWARCLYIALLCNQSSADEPTQYRVGTIWHRNTDNAYLCRNASNTAWVDISEMIMLRTDITETGSGEYTSLKDLWVDIQSRINSIMPRMTYSGTVATDFATSIPIPTSIQTVLGPIKDLMRPVLYVNGLLKDPRLYRFSVSCPTCIEIISGITLRTNDKFTVVIERFDEFVVDDVIA